MAVVITHSFVSPKLDGPDPTVVRPTNWNDEHVVSGNGWLLAGMVLDWIGHTLPAYLLECYGQSIAAASYPTLFAAMVKQATATLTLGSPGIVNWTDHGLVPGSKIRFRTTGVLPTGLVANTDYFIVSTGFTTSAFRVAAAAEGTAINFTGSQSGTHTGVNAQYGASTDLTTFTVPDLRGRVTAGLDIMGGTSANRLTGVSGGVDGDVMGAVGGLETHTLTTAQLASHQHNNNPPAPTVTITGITVTVNSGGAHTHTVTGTVDSGGAHAHTATGLTVSGTNVAAPTHTHTVTGTISTVAGHTHTVTGTISTVADHTHVVTGTVAGTVAGTGSHTHSLAGRFEIQIAELPSSGAPATSYNPIQTKLSSLAGAVMDPADLTDAATHTHTWSGTFSSGVAAADGGHNHTLSAGVAASAGGHNHTLSAGVAAADGAHNHTWSGTVGGSTASAGAHTHTFSTGVAASAGAHTHTASATGTATSAQADFLSDAAGGGAAHNNVQPTFVLRKVLYVG